MVDRAKQGTDRLAVDLRHSQLGGVNDFVSLLGPAIPPRRLTNPGVLNMNRALSS